jgi:hypothetical protein
MKFNIRTKGDNIQVVNIERGGKKVNRAVLDFDFRCLVWEALEAMLIYFDSEGVIEFEKEHE